MIYRISNPNMNSGHSRYFLVAQVHRWSGANYRRRRKERDTLRPARHRARTEAEWPVVAACVGEALRPLAPKLSVHDDIIRTTESGIRWRHLDLTAAMLAENGVELQRWLTTCSVTRNGLERRRDKSCIP
jgi:hypothetical protein